MTGWVAIVLANTETPGMKSRLPVELHRVAGKEVLWHLLKAVQEAGPSQTWVVVPSRAGGYSTMSFPGVNLVTEGEARAWGPESLQAAEGLVLLPGNMPLLRPHILRQTRRQLEERGLPFLAFTSGGEGGGFLLWARGSAWPQVWQEWSRTGRLSMASLLSLVPISQELPDAAELLVVSDRCKLAQAEGAIQQRLRAHWMKEGVTLLDPPSTFLDATVHIGRDTVLYPHTILEGETQVGEGCHIGPYAMLRDSRVGKECRIIASLVEGAVLEEGVRVGPFSHLRPGTYLESQVQVGNFVEITRSRVGRGTKMAHFGYLGDATVGPGVNIGAGTVTCNFDGVSKHPTVVEQGAFIGSDSMLVAPVRIGAGAKTGAGSVVTRDVPPGTLALGVPARQKGPATTPLRREERRTRGGKVT